MLLGDLVVGLCIGAAYSLLAVAVVLVYSSTRALSIAMGEIGAFALYGGLYFTTHDVPLTGIRLSATTAALVAIIGGGGLGLLVERFIMRPLVQRPALDALVATLAVALLLALLELRMYGVQATPAPSPVGDGSIKVFGSTVTAARGAALVLAAVVAVSLWLFLTRTRFGLATRGTVSDPTVARLLGVKVNRVYMFAWGVGGALAGAAAALLGPIVGSLTPFSLTSFLLRALAGAVIGGLDSLRGAIAGSLLVGVIEAVVSPRLGPLYSALIVFAVVLGVLLLRGSGLSLKMRRAVRATA